jgi:hypothetical protein
MAKTQSQPITFNDLKRGEWVVIKDKKYPTKESITPIEQTLPAMPALQLVGRGFATYKDNPQATQLAVDYYKKKVSVEDANFNKHNK